MSDNQQHKIVAYVYSCFDPAIRDALAAIYDERFGKGNYFLDTDPGAAKNLVSPRKDSDRDHVLWKIKAARELHPFDLLVLVNHSDCGAYKLAGIAFDDTEKEESFHADELKKAIAVIQEAMPGLTVEIHYFLKGEQKMAW